MLSKFGRHFDVNPKGWRLFADFLENMAYGLEILTPVFPHLFVPIGAAAGAGRSAASLIQVKTSFGIDYQYSIVCIYGNLCSLYHNEGVLPCVYEHESYRVEPIIWSLEDVWLYLKIFIACLYSSQQ
jgi:hypothetical protein